jgi:hypothetical protein
MLRLHELQHDFRFKLSQVALALRLANKKMKFWSIKGVRANIARECANLSCMCAHMWRAKKLRAPWLQDWGLLPAAQDASPKEQQEPCAYSVTTAVAHTSVCVNSCWQKLPTWMLEVLDLDVLGGLAGSSGESDSSGGRVRPRAQSPPGCGEKALPACSNVSVCGQPVSCAPTPTPPPPLHRRCAAAELGHCREQARRKRQHAAGPLPGPGAFRGVVGGGVQLDRWACAATMSTAIESWGEGFPILQQFACPACLLRPDSYPLGAAAQLGHDRGRARRQ